MSGVDSNRCVPESNVSTDELAKKEQDRLMRSMANRQNNPPVKKAPKPQQQEPKKAAPVVEKAAPVAKPAPPQEKHVPEVVNRRPEAEAEHEHAVQAPHDFVDTTSCIDNGLTSQADEIAKKEEERWRIQFEKKAVEAAVAAGETPPKISPRKKRA